MKMLPVLGTIVALIAGQDPKTVAFPPNGNGSSSSEAGNNIELQPDVTRGGMAALVPAALVPPQPQPMMPSDYFFPGKDFSILVRALRRCSRV